MNNTTASGKTLTAPSTPADVQETKLMVIAICRGQDGQLVITPLAFDGVKGAVPMLKQTDRDRFHVRMR
jgi:hypothetical protein